MIEREDIKPGALFYKGEYMSMEACVLVRVTKIHSRNISTSNLAKPFYVQQVYYNQYTVIAAGAELDFSEKKDKVNMSELTSEYSFFSPATDKHIRRFLKLIFNKSR